MFSDPVSEWSTMRISFMAWLEYYFQIYQMEDPPPQHVIDNDETLDSFLRARRLKREHEERKSRLQANKPGKGKSTHEKLL